jgi:hypothetical protein
MMVILWVSVILRLGMKMADHCIPHVFLDEKTIHERMTFLFVETTTTNSDSMLLICALTSSTPSFSW